MFIPELLAPAGSPEALSAAIGEGADAVYLGLRSFNARMRSVNFTFPQFEEALRALHRRNRKIYVTVNTVFQEREADRMYQLLKYLAELGPDAIIVQDFGVVEMAKHEFPSLRLHASTQMNIASARGANALSRHGVSRVVLARELSLEELRSVKKETNLELEVFVHGALCISVSGICLFSSFLGGKSANRGMCTQACRRQYHITSQSQGGSAAKEESGYFFSPNDLQLLDRVPDLYEAGIKALKIEGRMKSASYVGAVVSAYRLVVDAVMRHAADSFAQSDKEDIRQSIEQGREILRNDFARAKTQYLFTSHESDIDWLNPKQDGGTGINLGTIQKTKTSGDVRTALVTPPKGITLSTRDSVRIHHSDDSGRISHKLISAEKQPHGNSYWISLPLDQSFGEAKQGDSVYLIQTKEMRKRYPQIITENKGGKGPGRDKAPPMQSAQLKQRAQLTQRELSSKTISSKKNEAKIFTQTFPEGVYAAVSRPEDLYVLQSSRPQRVMLSLSKKTAKYLLAEDKQPLPFKPQEIILTLDPFFPQSAAGYGNEIITDEIKQLIKKGYHQYTVNNPGHFSLFKEHEKVKLIAGPWLYIFNSWSLSFISSLGADWFIPPLENNRQNLERTLGEDKKLRKMFFITVFAWPPLFNIRTDLSPVLKFNSFADNMDENFLLITEKNNIPASYVYPQKYFSIVDKIPFLKEAGFVRFIIDLRGPILKKSNYKDLMKAVNECSPLPDSCRFNWKDGFYSNKE